MFTERIANELAFINVRDVMLYDAIELNSVLPEYCDLEFEDGTIMNGVLRSMIVISRCYWSYHELYPELKIIPKHFILKAMGNERFKRATHPKMIEIIIKDIVKQYCIRSPIEMETITKQAFLITAELLKVICVCGGEYVQSMDIVDVLQIQMHPVVQAAIALVVPDPTPTRIQECYATIEKFIKETKELEANPVIIAVRSGMVNTNQVLQCLAVRGYLKEVNNQIFKTPVLSNFTMGLYETHEWFMEARSASQSLYMAEAPLEDSEYFARRMRLFTGVVKNIWHGDCGSTNYMYWTVMGPQFDDTGKKTYIGDLPNMLGKIYVDDVTGELKTIEEDDPALWDKTLKLRSAHRCKYVDPHYVCAVCFGALSLNVSRFANLGNLCSATGTKQVTQLTLSNKHYQASAISSSFIIFDYLRSFLIPYIPTNGQHVCLSRHLLPMFPHIAVPRDEFTGYLDIKNIRSEEEFDKLNPSRMSSISSLGLLLTKDSVTEMAPLETKQKGRNTELSYDFLYYVWSHPEYVTVDVNNNYLVNMTEWDYSKPIFGMPDMEQSYADLAAEIANLIERPASEKNGRTRELIDHRIQRIFRIATQKLTLNLACLEVIMYAASVPELGSYEMSRGAEEPVHCSTDLLTKYRSLGVACAYQDHQKVLTSPSSYLPENKVGSYMDVFLKPAEVTTFDVR